MTEETETSENVSRPRAPKPTVAEVRRLIATELSLSSRLGYAALLLVSLTVAGVTGGLLLGEAGLPLRTRAAFALMAGMALAWTVLAIRVLGGRRVLLAGHRVAAARMAVVFTAAFAAGSVAFLVWRGGGPIPYAAVATGIMLLVVASIHLRRAVRRFAALSHRRAELERRLMDAKAARGS